MKAVVLEDYAIQQGDLDWSGVKALVPDITRYGRTAQEEVVPRIGDAEIVFLNKCRIDEAVLAQCPKLRWVGIIATGTDNLDLKACRRHGVPVANVPGYSTYSVAQMTFSLLLAICQCADRYDRLVQDGRWRTDDPAAYRLLPQASPLRGLPNALLTPHIAWATNEALQRLMDITANNLRTWLDGTGENIVNA